MLGFLYDAICLKSVPRTGWIDKLEMARPESVADHTYMTCIMAMVFSDQKRLDTAKVMRMALLHDVAESRTGDMIPAKSDAETKSRLEEDAMRKILGKLPEPSRDICVKTWNEYKLNATPEARLVRQVDKLEAALQARLYADDERTEPIINAARQAVQDADLRDLLNQIG